MIVKIRNVVPAGVMVGLFTAVTLAQTPALPIGQGGKAAKPAAAAVKPAAATVTPGMTITATSANVSGAGEKIEFYINRWSTDADRDKLSTAWNTKPAAPADAGAR